MGKLLAVLLVLAAGFFAVRALFTHSGGGYASADFSPIAKAASTMEAFGNVDTFKFSVLRAPDSRFSRQIVWLKEEGSEVSKGELVAKFDASDIAFYLEELAIRTQSLIEDRAAFDLAWDTTMETSENSVSMQMEAVALQDLDVDQKKYHAALVRKMAQIRANNQRGYLGALQSQKDRLAQQRKIAEGYQNDKMERHKKNIKKAEDLISLYDIRAPYDSVISYPQIYIAGILKKAEQGDSLVQLQEFARLPDFSSKCVVLRMREHGIKSLRKGQKVEFYARALPGVKFTGEIKSFSATPTDDISGEESRRYFEANVALDKSANVSSLMPGMTVSARIFLGEYENVYAIPVDYVSSSGGKMTVEILSVDGARRKIEVSATASDENFVYILASELGGKEIKLVRFSE